MGKKRTRNTAKSGDKAVYKSRQHHHPSASKSAAAIDSDDDATYNEVDRYHNRREEEEFLRFEAGKDEEAYDDGISKSEGILDLGEGSDSSSSDDEVSREEREQEYSMEEEPSSGSEDEDELDAKESDIRDWGKRKSAYYHGDTADLEIGQDEDDAFLEEEAAKEVQSARYKEMEEDDFIMSDAEEDARKKNDIRQEEIEQVRSERDLSKLSRSERRRLLQSHHPELIPLVTHFAEVLREWKDRTRVVQNALLQSDEEGPAAEAVGSTPAGIQLLITKSLLQSSAALNVAMYCLLKSEQSVVDFDATNEMLGMLGIPGETSRIQAHPVTTRLQQLNNLAQKLEDRVESKVENLSDQYEKLVRASALVDSVNENDEMGASDQSEQENEACDPAIESRESVEKDEITENEGNGAAPVKSSSSNDKQLIRNEARFGLRPQEIGENFTTEKKPKQRSFFESDFGDDEDVGIGKAFRLASTMNTIEQRSSTQTRKRRAVPALEDLDLPKNEGGVFQRGLEMMEAELGRLESDDAEVDFEGKPDLGLDDDEDDDDDFYSLIAKKRKAKKKSKKDHYQVAPKYPGMDDEVEGERAISMQILKNRGLVAHKSKLNRNPRVKKREQYRKALIRRKGTVREVRTDEGHKYGGEQTGIKAGLSRSRKLGV